MTNSKNIRNEEPVSLDSSKSESYPCPEWEGRLVCIHPDDLTEVERMELFKHLSQCSKCTTFRRRYRAVNDMIRDLPFQEEIPTLALPSKLVRLWEFEAMVQSRELPLSCEEALLHRRLLSEISEQVENKRTKDQHEVLQEMKQEERNETPARDTRSWVTGGILFVVTCLLPFIYRIIGLCKCGSTGKSMVGKRAQSTPEKEQKVVTV